ncbi:MAG: 3-hydroxybutyryl-CoA dehydrogenase [Deltaproteobacteria bacterium]|nr:3-hydroxybutyryl-CoA dehydrogenase [Deltaproteobacteria bacterium]
MAEIKVLGVVGAGQMGNGISQVAAQSGIDVICTDVNQGALDKARDTVKGSLGRLVKKEKLTQAQADEALKRITFTADLQKLSGADLVVEAATENEKLKKTIFDQLDKIARPGVILATNTSSISVTRLAAGTSRPERFIGMHFMNPVPMMQLVEIIRGLVTSDETYAATKALAEKMGKTVTTSKDLPGFIANRLLMPMINEAFCALEQGLSTAEDIDTTMKLGMNHPMGPLALADLIGLDTCLAIMEVLHTQFGDSKYRPNTLLRQYVDAGLLGRKSHRGVYRYDDAKK